MPGALLTDLYELNMAASYLRRGMRADATFSLYVRTLPPERGFLVAAGLEPCLEFLESFSFTEEDLAWLEGHGFDRVVLEAFRELRFTGQVWAIPEGRIVRADEPLLEVTAPLPQAQLAETLLLNQITLHTTVASKAARYRLAAGDADLVDFAFRRTHGVDAAMAVARAAAIVGFAATSNVEAARRYGLTAAGTMAHSYVEAFDTEAEAFLAFAEDFPQRATFLVDTYDTLEGVRAAIETIRRLHLSDGLGVRLDSGDLDRLSREARRLLDEAGLGQVRIFASGGLDELRVEELSRAGVPIDAYGIGTQMGVSADAPFVDSVYKLTEYGGRAVLKLSADKATTPGRKQVFRSHEGDVIGLRNEDLAGERLLVPVMERGARVGPTDAIGNMRERFEADLAALPEGAKRLVRAEPLDARHSAALASLAAETREDARTRAGLPANDVDG
ncbi:MAG: nicotinate phosphoribosyltransferase [Actinobacteria bacterium]|nr:nicotinate phosphoribosyltransferase [Actinomycetota bacterium]